MSQSAVLDYVEATIESISSTPSGTLPCRQGLENEGPPIDMGQFPLVVLSITNEEPEQITFGPQGTVFEKYDVDITLFLGPPGMTHKDAMARAKLFSARFRAKFIGNQTLGGSCWKALLWGPTDNLEIGGSMRAVYQDANQYPYIKWALKVIEQTTMDATAS